jgi:hypothetical protein
MRKLFILTLGLVLAAASATAFAGGRYDHGWYDHRYDHRYDRRDRTHRDAYLVGGLLLGLAAGAALADNDDGYRRGAYYYDSRYDRGGYRGGYYGGYYHGGGGYYGSRPYYGGREVIVRHGRPCWIEHRYYAGPRRVVHYHYDARDPRW